MKPDQFEYVMILVSIVIGLGITHVISHFAKIQFRLTKRGKPVKLYLAHSIFSINILLWMVIFWWFEYNFRERIETWSIVLYMFITFYAIMIFLTSHILLPSTSDDIEDFGDYFIDAKNWFYSFLIALVCIDFVDAYLKGVDYLLDFSPVTWSYFIISITVGIVGMIAKSRQIHNALAIVFFVEYILVVLTGYFFLG